MLQTAVSQRERQDRLTNVADAAAQRAWRLGDVELLTTTLATLQVRAAREAEAGVAQMLAEQEINAPAEGRVNLKGFTTASDGRPIATLLAEASSSAALSRMAVTQVADMGRASAGVATVMRPKVQGHIRHVGPKCCSRCAILAGRFYRWSSGFERHPNCLCTMVPTDQESADDLIDTPDQLFREGRITDLTKTQQRAIEDGADMNQVVNAYRRTSGMQVAQVSPIKVDRFGNKFTTEGSTKRALAYKRQKSLRQNGPVQMRLMPESIYKRAADRPDAIRMLKLYGWIL